MRATYRTAERDRTERVWVFLSAPISCFAENITEAFINLHLAILGVSCRVAGSVSRRRPYLSKVFVGPVVRRTPPERKT